MGAGGRNRLRLGERERLRFRLRFRLRSEGVTISREGCQEEIF